MLGHYNKSLLVITGSYFIFFVREEPRVKANDSNGMLTVFSRSEHSYSTERMTHQNKLLC